LSVTLPSCRVRSRGRLIFCERRKVTVWVTTFFAVALFLEAFFTDFLADFFTERFFGADRVDRDAAGAPLFFAAVFFAGFFLPLVFFAAGLDVDFLVALFFFADARLADLAVAEADLLLPVFFLAM